MILSYRLKTRRARTSGVVQRDWIPSDLVSLQCCYTSACRYFSVLVNVKKCFIGMWDVDHYNPDEVIYSRIDLGLFACR